MPRKYKSIKNAQRHMRSALIAYTDAFEDETGDVLRKQFLSGLNKKLDRKRGFL